MAEVAPACVLLRRPWLPVSIDGCHLLAKSSFGETAYHVMLTDMHCVWQEKMDSVDIQSRAQELNKRLRAPVKAFFSHLCEVVQPRLEGAASDSQHKVGTQMSVTRQEDGNLCMKLKSELAGLPFYWEFHCTPVPITMVCSQLVRPLLAMSRLLQSQVQHLGDLLVKKDAEIQDYRENGATLTRERLKTDIFEAEPEGKSFNAKTLPLVCSEQLDTLGFNSNLQHLYNTIVGHDGSTKKRKLSEQDQVVSMDPTPPALSGDEPGEAESEQNQLRQVEPSKAKTADTSTIKQTLPERQASKPKKKKVGLFR